MDGDESEDIQICRGVRQGCILFPLLFNVYADIVFKEVLKEMEEGIKMINCDSRFHRGITTDFRQN